MHLSFQQYRGGGSIKFRKEKVGPKNFLAGRERNLASYPQIQGKGARSPRQPTPPMIIGVIWFCFLQMWSSRWIFWASRIQWSSQDSNQNLPKRKILPFNNRTGTKINKRHFTPGIKTNLSKTEGQGTTENATALEVTFFFSPYCEDWLPTHELNLFQSPVGEVGNLPKLQEPTIIVRGC